MSSTCTQLRRAAAPVRWELRVLRCLCTSSAYSWVDSQCSFSAACCARQPNRSRQAERWMHPAAVGSGARTCAGYEMYLSAARPQAGPTQLVMAGFQ